MMMYRQNQHLTLVGKVAGVHGLRGELAVFPLTDDPERFFELDCVFIDTEDPAGGPPQPQEIEGVRIHKGRVLLKVASIQDRTAAERLVGHQVFIRNEDRKELAENQFFVDQLVGLAVEAEDGRQLGTVQAVTEIPSGHLLAIQFENGRTVDVPFVKAYVASVDTELGRVVLMASYEGLLNPEEVR